MHVSGGDDDAGDTMQSARKGARWAMALLLAINLFNYLDRQVLAAVVPQVRDELLASPDSIGPVVRTMLDALGSVLGGSGENAMMGLLAMAFMVTYMVAAPILSNLPFKRWWVIAGGIAIWSLASGATGLAMSFGVLLLTRCLVGIGEAAYGPVGPAVLTDYFPKKKRGMVMSAFYLAIPVGSALGFLFAGYIAGTSLGWRWAFYLVVPPGILLAILCLFMKDPEDMQEAAKAARKVKKKTSRLKEYRFFLTNRSYLLNTLAMTAMTFAIGGIGFWMPTYVSEFRQAGSLSSVNMIFGAILVVSGLSATFFGGWLADKLAGKLNGSYFWVSGAAMIAGFPLFLAVLFVPFPYAWIFVFLSCFCLFMNTGPSNTALANCIHTSLRPSAFALCILITHAFGDVISPLVIGAVTDAFNMNVAFTVVSVMMLVGGILWLIAAPRLQQDMDASGDQLKLLDK
ncbi:MAG: MFS transporter [Candidatus Obscuribacterales bacterium]|nr:MFS transporter [Candidatus Obscuribacterales bacterium]